MQFFTDDYGFRIENTEKKKKEVLKDEAAFSKKQGVCYTDKNGRQYTYEDLFSLVRDEKAVSALFDRLHYDTPEDAMEGSWLFKKCPRCKTWLYDEDRSFMKKHREQRCPFCTPLRTDGHIKTVKDPYQDDRKFYVKKEAVFMPGLTTIIGCNVIGKTTLLDRIRHELKSRGTPYLYFDNLGDEGGERSSFSLLGKAVGGFGGDIGYAASLLSLSEGERIAEAVARYGKTVTQAFTDNLGYGEMWLIFDALDSGLSPDHIEDIKEYVFRKILDAVPEETRVYIIVSSNSYEMSAGTACFSVAKMRYLPIRSYNAFLKEIRASRKYKEERDEVLRIKAEIREHPYTLTMSDEDYRTFHSWDGEDVDKDVAVMEKGPYRMVLHLKEGQRHRRSTISLYKKENGIEKKVPCGEVMIDSMSNPREIKEEMHECICRKMFLDRKRERKHRGNAVQEEKR